MLGINILKKLGGGSGGGTVNLQDDTVVGSRYAQWFILNDGFTYERHNSGSLVKNLSWINPQSGMDLYEVRATDIGTDTPPGTIGSWIPITNSTGWGWSGSLVQKEGQLTIEIRRASDLVVVDSATITLFVSGIQ